MEERRKLRSDSAPSSEVPTAVLISFDDEPPAGRVKGDSDECRGNAERGLEADRRRTATDPLQLDASMVECMPDWGGDGGGASQVEHDADKKHLVCQNDREKRVRRCDKNCR